MNTTIEIFGRALKKIRFQKEQNRFLKMSPFKETGKELCPSNFGRALGLTEFLTYVPSLLNSKQSIRVAVIGGSPEEYELEALRKVGFEVSFQVFGIDGNSILLDLNSENAKTQDLPVRFDLVLCSQVLEHTWNIGAVFKNLTHLISSGALIWVGAPASNRFHGSPDFYSAGYTAKFIELNFEKLGIATLRSGQIGTKRNYLATHILPRWLSVRTHGNPIFFSIGHGNFFVNVFFFLRYLPWTLLLFLTSPRLTNDSRYATESWFLGTQKPS
jgi:hypothetical protein